MKVALINTNMMKPPIAPIGLDYVAESLAGAGWEVGLLDLCWAEDPAGEIADFFGNESFGLVGVSLRNTDDCAFATGESFLEGFSKLIGIVRSHTDAPVIVGGVGLSIMPEYALKISGADAAVRGEGELVFPMLAERVADGSEWRDLPNLVWMKKGSWQRNPLRRLDLESLPVMRRRWVDNVRYFSEGGQAGIETKRGCDRKCIYCADPVAKGSSVRLRPPEKVVDELEALLAQGIDTFHTCDSEFNLPGDHARDVCDEIIRRKLGDRVKWFAYCSPVPFSGEMAMRFRQAGCVGINFGVDSGDPSMLRTLRRNFGPGDILEAVKSCREAGITVMLDLLIGGPGETKESISTTVNLMKMCGPDRVGVAVGVRVYPETELHHMMAAGTLDAGLIGDGGGEMPLFFIDPAVSSSVFALLDELVGGDERFFFFDPERPERNYNYNSNELLVEAIGEGYRGAYWDILRRYRGRRYGDTHI